jgi:hypothetical protein
MGHKIYLVGDMSRFNFLSTKRDNSWLHRSMIEQQCIGKQKKKDTQQHNHHQPALN